jgi:hypothetical protein
MNKVRRPIWISLVVTLVLLGVAMLFVDVMPPKSRTAGAMTLCKRRILRYARAQGRLPLSLDVTSPIDGHDTSVKDAWGVVIEYEVGTDGTVTLRSLGKDRRPGGTGDNQDLVGTFPSRQANGSWSDELVEWSKPPFEMQKGKTPNQAL